MTSSTAALLFGCWQLVAADPAFPTGDRVEMEFKPTGELIYATLEKKHWAIMRLTYKVDGKHIVSNQPSAPREERTEFSFGRDGVLNLSLGGTPSAFKRIPKCTFPLPQPRAGVVQRLKSLFS